MGALTVTRKRCCVDTSFPSNSSSPFPEVFPHNPFSKRLKISLPLPPSSSARKKGVSLLLEQLQFPPSALLLGKVQGPQRNMWVFGLCNSEMRPEKKSEITLRGWSSRITRKIPLCSIWRSLTRLSSWKDGKIDSLCGKGVPAELNLEDYQRLVEDSAEFDESKHERGRRGFAFPRTPSPAVSDLRVFAGQDWETPNPHVFNRKVEDGRKLDVKLTPGSEDVRWTRGTLSCKDLLQETSKKHPKLTKEKISGIHLSREERPKEDLEEAFAPLTDEEENDVNIALQNPNKLLRKSDIIVMHEPSNIQITREIIQCLKHGAWLNDEVINLYLELLKERENRNPKKFLKCHFFNTFFYKKLTSGRDHYDFKAVRRWTTQRMIGYSLIDCDKIFVPIHKEIHWCLAVINVKDKKFQFLDSLGSMDEEVLTVLATYLTDEVKDKNNKVIDVTSWKQEFVHGLPLQRNGWDCGMFMLKYADFYSRGLGLSFSQDNMKYFRRRTMKEILRLRAE